MTAFKDHFSPLAGQYAEHRPVWPAALVDFLAACAPSTELAWDAGCGSGQLSVPLAARFERVVATDASAEQIERASPHGRVTYRAAPAEASGLPDTCADLVVAAQAAHWFDLDAWYAEARRVMRRRAVIALACYGDLELDGEPGVLLDRFRRDVLIHCWPPERRHVLAAYRTLPFPFDETTAPAITMRATWSAQHVLGYVRTWSAVRQLLERGGSAALDAFAAGFAAAAGEEVLAVRWPLAVRLGR